MQDAHELLAAIAVVLGVAAVTTVLFHRLRQPVVLGYILAGLIVGPHVPWPLVANPGVVQTLSELGVILLMFALGLEFSLRKLVQVGPVAGLTAVVESSIMAWLGFLAGRALGFTPLESVFAGAMVAMSSTTIVAKAFQDLHVRGPLRDLVVGVLLVEDLFAILLMAILTAVATGTRVSAGALGGTVGRLAAFLAVLLAAGMLTVPRAVRWVRRLGSSETLLVLSLGLCFGISYLAFAFGYSVALGAFIAGALVAESGEGHTVERLVRPVRDLFAAIFFVSVGMLIDPALVARNWKAIAVLVPLVLLGKSVAVGTGALLTGNGVRLSIQAALSLAQIGEFSFILASLGISLGATRDFLFPVAVAVSAVTTLTSPRLIGASARIAAAVDARLPAPFQTAASLYGSWLERLRSSPAHDSTGRRVRRFARSLLVDAVVVVGIVIGTSVALDRVSVGLAAWLGLPVGIARLLVLVAGGAAALPFCVGLLRNGRRIGIALASAALPEASAGTTDLAAAPRRALLSILELATAALVLMPLLAITQPFLPGVPGAAFLGVAVMTLGIAFWRSSSDLQGHVRASAFVIVEALAKEAAAPVRPAQPHEDALAAVRAMFPGLGEPVAVRLPLGSPAVARSLAELGVRGSTGATVLAIARAGGSVMIPSSGEVLRDGDVLALAGTHEAVEAACALLAAEPVAPHVRRG